MSDCPHCGWPDSRPVQDLSQHPTEEGVLSWTRCVCGSVQARLLTAGTVRIVARGQPAPTHTGDREPEAARDAARHPAG
ncbi:hypothetical protein [Streptomyces marispadix]|uniref:Uncharacterized protein n=1 Tax=Streptomyces marispadix TaxID=2922868 RepID=A0ABS9SWI8_9ACTN|nr:hypothetical protein [Streptomyces marispadix]MCH6160657.1 hypothetical protein [Streptomyces marispadix]